MTLATPLMAKLKESIQPYHKRLESKVDWFKPGFSQADYLELLQRFWTYYSPLEQKLSQIPELKLWLPDFGQRAKLPLLAQDLQNLGLTADTLSQMPLCAELPQLNEPEAALGCLYVIEGSTLGGQVISSHLKQTFAIGKTNGAAFFTGYGDATGTMWQTFKEAINQAEVNQETVITAACETFTTLERWLCPSDCLTGTPDNHDN
jgi:heme oxygenase